MELYFGHKGYIYTCNILNPEQIQTKLNDNINQYIHTGNILFEITNIETITGQILPHESKFKLHQSLSIFIKLKFLEVIYQIIAIVVFQIIQMKLI